MRMETCFARLLGLGAIVAVVMTVLGANPAAAADLLIRNVTLIDGTGAAPLKGTYVTVIGDRIDAVSAAPVQPRAGMRVIDGTGKYLIPGLIDSHIHLVGGRLQRPDGEYYVDRRKALSNLQGYLYSGVTSVVDLGNNEPWLFGLRDEERKGGIVSPRIFAAGAVTTRAGGYGDTRFAVGVSDDWEASKAKLEAHFAAKPDIEKILLDGQTKGAVSNILPLETARKIVRLANERGVKTTVHVGEEEQAWKAIDAGIDSFAHPLRYSAGEDYINVVATKGLPVTTTLAVFNYIQLIGRDTSFLDDLLFKAIVDPADIALQKGAERDRYIKSGMSKEFEGTIREMSSVVKRLYDRGAILAMGTDRTWGASVHMELDLLHKAGIPLLDCLTMGTLNGARFLGKEKDLGSVQRGKLADLVLLNADPLADVKNFQSIAMVIKGGQQIDLKALDLPVNRGR